ncbi:hypothetical protein HDU97_003553 [Phlyctochytrium planicorne]|nr:hypothetical protein HDU97_003553 [Phlyctochytrium planicorne]
MTSVNNAINAKENGTEIKPEPMAGIILKSIKLATVYASSWVIGLTVQVARSLLSQIAMTIAINAATYSMFKILGIDSGESARPYEFLGLYWGSILAKTLLFSQFQRADITKAGNFWLFCLFQISLERLVPRLSLIISRVQAMLAKRNATAVAPEIHNDQTKEDSTQLPEYKSQNGDLNISKERDVISVRVSIPDITSDEEEYVDRSRKLSASNFVHQFHNESGERSHRPSVTNKIADAAILKDQNSNQQTTNNEDEYSNISRKLSASNLIDPINHTNPSRRSVSNMITEKTVFKESLQSLTPSAHLSGKMLVPTTAVKIALGVVETKHVLARNDYIFNNYVTTLAAAGYIGSFNENFNDEEEIKGLAVQMAVFLGLQIVSECIVMLLELREGEAYFRQRLTRRIDSF